MGRRFIRRRKGELRSLAELLEGAYPGRAEDRPLVQTFSWWDRTVPPRIAAHARPVELRRGTLIVHTRTAAWSQELSFHEADLLASIRAKVSAVRRLRIRVGEMPPPPKPPEPPPPKVTPLRVTELPAEVARALAMVPDDRLRDAIARAACTSLAPPPPDPSKDRTSKERGRSPAKKR
jgi:hypothetical protein